MWSYLNIANRQLLWYYKSIKGIKYKLLINNLHKIPRVVRSPVRCSCAVTPVYKYVADEAHINCWQSQRCGDVAPYDVRCRTRNTLRQPLVGKGARWVDPFPVVTWSLFSLSIAVLDAAAVNSSGTRRPWHWPASSRSLCYCLFLSVGSSRQHVSNNGIPLLNVAFQLSRFVTWTLITLLFIS